MFLGSTICSMRVSEQGSRLSSSWPPKPTGLAEVPIPIRLGLLCAHDAASLSFSSSTQCRKMETNVVFRHVLLVFPSSPKPVRNYAREGVLSCIRMNLRPNRSRPAARRHLCDRPRRKAMSIWSNCGPHGRGKNTVRAYRKDAFRFLDAVEKPLHRVTLGDLQSFADDLAQQSLKASSVYRTLSAVKLRWKFDRCRPKRSATSDRLPRERSMYVPGHYTHPTTTALRPSFARRACVPEITQA
jgi:hypothetical protein